MVQEPQMLLMEQLGERAQELLDPQVVPDQQMPVLFELL